MLLHCTCTKFKPEINAQIKPYTLSMIKPHKPFISSCVIAEKK